MRVMFFCTEILGRCIKGASPRNLFSCNRIESRSKAVGLVSATKFFLNEKSFYLLSLLEAK